MSCTDCSLHKSCLNSYLTGRGSRPNKTKIMVIQEYPTYFDDRCGRSYAGDTIKKLNYFFEKSGIDYREVYYTSALKCSPKKSSDIKNVHLDACRKYLFHEITTHKPEVIIAMGRWAYQAVTDKTSIREFRGHFDEFEIDVEREVNGKDIVVGFKTKVMPTWNLNTSLKKWEYNKDIISDFTKVQKYIKTGKIDRTPEPNVNLILDKRGLKDFVEKYREVKYATTDFETTGFDFWRHKIINAGYAADGINADVVYLTPYHKDHVKKWTREEIEHAKQINSFLKQHRKDALKALKIVNDFEHLKLILHNGKFDIKFARYYGIDYRNFWFDTLMADPLIDENLGHALNIAMERRGINYGAYDTALWPYINKDENKKKSYQYVPSPLLVKYLGIDVCGDYRLFKKQWKELKKEKMMKHFFDTKMPALYERIDAEYTGVKADRKLIMKASRMVNKKQDKLKEKFTEITGNPDFNPNSDVQVSNYMSEAGYPFKRLKVKETTRGHSTAKEELEKFLPFKKWKEFPQLILNYKKLAKIKGTYIDGKNGVGGMLQYLDHNDRIHANYNLWTPRTSRYSCFARGTKIEIVRDLSKDPKGINIEDVKVGDLAYCYDNEKNLVLRPVKKVFKNGVKKVVRVHWVSSGGRLGYIDVTPDHELRTLEMGYLPVTDLKRGDKLLFMSRKASNYNQIMYHGCPSGHYDHHFVYEQTKGDIDKVNNEIHHLDHNKYNNKPENLVQWGRLKHKSHHAKIWSSKEEFKRRSSKQLKDRWENHRDEMLKNMSGSNNALYKGWSKYKLLKIIISCGCVIKKSGYDYYTIRKYLDLHGIDYKSLKDRFTHNGEFIPSWKIKHCFDKPISYTKKFLKIGQNKWYRLKDDYTFDTNHKFLMVEELNQEVEVYDLEIEEFHNYIAGEICAHNCNSPSLQVWPRPIKGLPNTRNFIIPEKGKGLWEADYSQLEQCVVAALSRDPVLTKRIQDGIDLHCINAADLGRILKTIPQWVTYEHMLVANDKAKAVSDQDTVPELIKDIEKHGKDINFKEKRTQAKNIGFGLNYGKTAMTFAEDFGISIDEAEEMIDAYFEMYNVMKKWRDHQVDMALNKGYVILPSGRKRRFDSAIDWLKSSWNDKVWSSRMLEEEIARQAMNYPVQGGAHEVFEPACIRLKNRFDKEDFGANILLSIHDGVVGEYNLGDEQRALVSKCVQEEMTHTFNKGTKFELTLKVDEDFYEYEWYGNKIS